MNKIGIWGFGTVGKAVLKFLLTKDIFVEIIDSRKLNLEEMSFLEKNNVKYFGEESIKDFLERNDIIIPSPGIDLRNFKKYSNKWLMELDIFEKEFNKKKIAITGSLGKTTITDILEQFIPSSKAIGNIGIGSLELISKKNDIATAIIEVSSFQLEYCKKFAPDLAIFTNFYPNHLDRHGTITEYFNAKANIFLNQNTSQHALLPLEILDRIDTKKLRSNISFFTNKYPEDFTKKQQLFYIENDIIFIKSGDKTEKIISLKKLPQISFRSNWLIIVAALKILNIDIKIPQKITIPAHRLEMVKTIKNVIYYNDSKSTIPQATLAAVNSINSRPIILIIGGIGKGFDRTYMIKELKNKVEKILCFGGEAKKLEKVCKENNIESKKFNTLEETILYAIKTTLPGRNVLFSPAGTSFDLFKNFVERGNRFKEILEKCLKEKII